MECPVCLNEYSLSQIEEHVDKCLAGRSDVEDSVMKNPKRSYPFENIEQNALKKMRKSNFLEPSTSQNFKNQKTVNPPKKNVKNPIAISEDSKNRDVAVSLAELLRPTNFKNYVGQKKILGPESALGGLLRNGQITSMILWGPPGCGKTSLANVIANCVEARTSRKMRFVKLSATSSGVGDVRKAVSTASQDFKLGVSTILFMDEIHRFNKLQQDIFLPHVEAGTFFLVGATTENPSFSLNSALLSRCRIFVLEKLSLDETTEILERGIVSMGGALLPFAGENNTFAASESSEKTAPPKFLVEREGVKWLANSCDGDAGLALGSLEIAAKDNIAKFGVRSRTRLDEPLKLCAEHFRNGLERSHTLLQGKFDSKPDLISAMHKSVRAGDSNASLYWLARLMASGEDPVYTARRLVRIASEDIGIVDPEALEIAVHAMHACQMIGMPECDVMLGQCAVYMARALKSRSINDALRKAQKIVSEQKETEPLVT